MNTEGHYNGATTPTDCLRVAETGRAVLETRRAGVTAYYTPVYEVLPGHWVCDWDGTASLVGSETVEMDVSDPQSEVRVTTWASSPFEQPTGGDDG